MAVLGLKSASCHNALSPDTLIKLVVSKVTAPLRQSPVRFVMSAVGHFPFREKFVEPREFLGFGTLSRTVPGRYPVRTLIDEDLVGHSQPSLIVQQADLDKVHRLALHPPE